MHTWHPHPSHSSHTITHPSHTHPRQYTIRTRQHPSQQRNKPNNNNQENSILPGQSGMLARFMQALEQLTIHRNNIAWLCLVRAFACVLHSDLAARLQWVQAVEGRDDVEGTRNTVLRAGFWHRLLAPVLLWDGCMCWWVGGCFGYMCCNTPHVYVGPHTHPHEESNTVTPLLHTNTHSPMYPASSPSSPAPPPPPERASCASSPPS